MAQPPNPPKPSRPTPNPLPKEGERTRGAGTPPDAAAHEPSKINTDHADAYDQATLAAPSPPENLEAFLAGPSSLVGQTFGDFELLAEVGRGGMGIVYKAKQISLERTVALKMLLAEHFRNPVSLSRFLAEARASAGLSHPNIVSVYQVGECSAGPYFVMEFIDGRSVESLTQDRAVPISWAVSLLIPIADAVHYAHTKGIIHRDLKPANLMIDQFRRPVIMDFGIAKFVGKPSSLTQYGSIMGTPAYMPPEQAGEDISQVGPHSDVYSLGAILYTLLTGKLPYDEGSALRTILKVISADMPPTVRSFRREVPLPLEAICMKCLNKDPADRFASAKELADELRHFRASPSSKPAPSSKRMALPSVFLVAAKTGKPIRLPGKNTVIGRSAECDLVLKFSDVSKRHCRILLEDDQVTVEDLDSANGTSVNGETVQRAKLKDGDELTIARQVFKICLGKPDKA